MELKNWVFALVMAISLYTNLIIGVAASEMCLDPNLLKNKIIGSGLTNTPFLVYQSNGFMDCYRQCGLYALCYSVNFNTVTLQCELHDVAHGNMQKNSDTIFVAMEISSAGILGVCKNHGCPVNTKCEVNGPRYTCVEVSICKAISQDDEDDD
ncbi:hypothetical protein SNE40_016025 [Patella caerulea]|uniref:Uncharacterized protein n=1 Tax=Patella caerulea TaxID=87958 RepID=A0AAN8J808_PATCE